MTRWPASAFVWLRRRGGDEPRFRIDRPSILTASLRATGVELIDENGARCPAAKAATQGGLGGRCAYPELHPAAAFSKMFSADNRRDGNRARELLSW
jgi:hypothetical protein